MIIRNIFKYMDACEVKFKKKKKDEPEQKTNVLKELIDNPEKFQLNAVIEGEEIIIKINRREEN